MFSEHLQLLLHNTTMDLSALPGVKRSAKQEYFLTGGFPPVSKLSEGTLYEAIKKETHIPTCDKRAGVCVIDPSSHETKYLRATEVDLLQRKPSMSFHWNCSLCK
jgi:hypothetical protein